MPERQLKSIIHHAMRTGAGLSKNQASTGAACMKNQLGRHDRLAYLAAAGGALHFYLLVKADTRLPLAFAGALGVFLGYRVLNAWFPTLAR